MGPGTDGVTPRAASPGAASLPRLLDRARAGDAAALDEILALSLPSLERWARGHLPEGPRDGAATRELVRDAAFGALRQIGTTESWPLELQTRLCQAVAGRIAQEPPAAPSPLECAVGREGLERYGRALQRLSPQEREAIVVRIEFGYSYDETAVALALSDANAARDAVARALLRLIQEMEHGG